MNNFSLTLPTHRESKECLNMFYIHIKEQGHGHSGKRVPPDSLPDPGYTFGGARSGIHSFSAGTGCGVVVDFPYRA